MKTKTEYVSIGNGVKTITKQEAEENKTDNIYFLDGVREDLDYTNGKRATDDDIILKDIFVLDLDIRNNCDYEVSDEDIIKEGENFAKHLEDEDEYFGEWSKIVFTGNGLHIYYTGTPKKFDKETYSMGVERIYRQWDDMMGAKVYNTDHACKNLARILRLPGSINQKNGSKVFVIAERNKKSRLFDMIGSFAKKELQEKEEIKKQRQKEFEKQMKSFDKSENNAYDTINKFPAWKMVQALIPEFPLSKNLKNFDNNKGGYTGYYYVEETNTICNGGSRYFNWGTPESCYNTFSLVKQHKNWTNKETFNFFKEKLGMK